LEIPYSIEEKVKTNFEYDKKISDQPISLFYLNEGCMQVLNVY